MKKFCFLHLVGFLGLITQAQTTASFDNLPLSPGSYWDGLDLSGGFTNGNAFFYNSYDTAYFIWSGFTYSNMKDSTTPGYLNQNSAITAIGYNGSPNYVVANEYGSAKVILTGLGAGKMVSGVYVTNATYTYLSMRDGDMFAKKFGGNSGNDPDWLKLTAIGWSNGSQNPKSAEFYLADFRFSDNNQDYLLRSWQYFDLQALGNVDSLQFFMTSSDTGQFGMNTPAYFALDNFTTADLSNTPPVANDDFTSTGYNNDTLVEVLTNDLDFTAGPVSLVSLGQPMIPGATASIVDNKLHYQPAVGIVATDTVRYVVCDMAGACDTGQLTVQVTGISGILSFDSHVALINAYPNPFHSNINLVLNNTDEESAVQITITDARGKIVDSFVTENEMNSLSLTDLASGIYYLSAHSNSSFSSIRIIKF